MSAPANEAVMSDFHARFRKLGPHPDKIVIDDLVWFSKGNSEQGYYIVKAIVSRFMDKNKDARNLLATLYSMDAIMINSGPSYPGLFSRYMLDVCNRGFDYMDARGRDKLKFLIQTWKDRKFFDESVQAELEALATDKMSRQAPHPTFQNQPPPALVGSLQPTARHHHLPPPPSLTVPSQASAQGNYESVLAAEKQTLLLELLQSLGQNVDAISLEELAESNVDLYNQICSSAEANARLKTNEGGVGATGAAFTPAIQQASFTMASVAVDGCSDGKLAEVIDKGRTADTFLSAWNERQHHASASDGDGFAKAFVGTDPVLVHLPSADEVHVRLDHNEQSLRQAQGEDDMDGGVKVKQEDETSVGAIPFPSKITDNASRRSSVLTAVMRAKRKLGEALKELGDPTLPPLPAMIMGPLPLQPSAQYEKALQAYLSEGSVGTGDSIGTGNGASRPSGKSTRFSSRKVEMPAFQTDQLALPPAYALQGLYVLRKYQFQEDGVRFVSQAALNAYVDTYASKQLMQRLTASIIKRRPWFCTEEAWQADYGAAAAAALDEALLASASADDSDAIIKPAGTSADTNNKAGEDVSQEYSVLADELFTRCPVSRERFVSTFDEDNGELWYKHAVKVFVSAAADVTVFNLGKDTIHPKIRYVIVNKPLVLDNWIETGKAAKFSNTIRRYENMGGEYGEKIEDLKTAAAEEDEDMCFVMLELGAN